MPDLSNVEESLRGSAVVKHRIVQLSGRRYSIKLEQGFWTFLEETARSHGLRLNQLVGRLAADHPNEIGFSAALRLYCLTEARARLGAAQEELHKASLATGTTDLAAIVGACPAPSVVLAYDRTIRMVNEPFARWLGADHQALIGKPVEHFFQIRGHFRLDELWARFGQGFTSAVPAKLAYVAPGRVVVAKAFLCATAIKGPDDFSCLIMLDHGATR
ncbi:MAG TPA: ribbon-helix-helix domain-containing protein [Alphaproteobacteria bacterium]|nr:ribbon-helix-helix domain-containing protein [Alphaproteobacteria bacterium]